jgi:hypothetical protein
MVAIDSPINMEDPWRLVSALEEDWPILIRVRSEIPVLPRQAFDWVLTISFPYEHHPSVKGMPDPQLRDVFAGIEDRLVQTLQPKGLGILTAVATGNGLCQWQWYISEDVARVTEAINQALSDLPEYPLHIFADADRSWTNYHSYFGRGQMESSAEAVGPAKTNE